MKGTKQVKMNLGILSVVLLEFYNAEVERLNSVINLIKTDLQLCLDVINNEAEVCTCSFSFFDFNKRSVVALLRVMVQRNCISQFRN